MDNEKRLLLEISKLSARIKQINESTGGLFNIFDITSVSHDEVTITIHVVGLCGIQNKIWQ